MAKGTEDKSIDKKSAGGQIGGTKWGQVPGEAAQPDTRPDSNTGGKGEHAPKH